MDGEPRFHLDDAANIAKPPVDDAVAKWQMLFPFGTRYRADFPGGKVELNREFLGQMLANFKRLAERYKGPDNFALPITFFHPDTDDDEVPVENKLAGGWILDLELRDDGLYALEKWNDETRALILGDKLRYQSPEFAFNWQDSFTGKAQGPTLFGASLLNNPFLKDMPRVAAADSVSTTGVRPGSSGGNDPGKAPPTGDNTATSPDAPSLVNPQVRNPAPQVNAGPNPPGQNLAPAPTGATTMPKPQLVNPQAVVAKPGDGSTSSANPMTPYDQIKKALGLPSDATPATVAAAFGKGMKDWAGTGMNSDTNPDGDPDYARGAKASDATTRVTLVEMQNETLKAQLAEAQKRITAVEAKEKTREALACVDKLQKDGKILAKQRDTVLKLAEQQGVAFVEEFYKDAPAVVAMGEIGVPGEPADGIEAALEQTSVKFHAKVDELVKGGAKYDEALRQAQRLLPAESRQLFSEKANASKPTVEN